MTRAEFEARLRPAAVGWLGVPFLHNGRTKSQGVDCLGLALCLFQELGFAVPTTTDYAPDWYRHTPEEQYLAGLLVHGAPTPRERLLPGDVLYFRPGLLSYSKIGLITHAGICLGDGEFVHAITNRPVAVGQLAHKAWRYTYAGAVRPLVLLQAFGETVP